ncbi:translation machinery-associated protein 20 [Trichomonascus vanleenenianus]|uniref:translation machinery-associated protein 20 n=1 Tax=Trichomonascus vanleenenianus TaxID=2268995 RepID=UPI003ECAEDF4
MFKKFTKEEIHSRANIKSSVQRSLRAKLLAQFPDLEPVIDDVVPKKSQLVQVKCANRMSLYGVNGEVIFTQHFDEDLVPTLRLVHKYPDRFPSIRVDRGAIKFILSGANIMCPGLTSKGGKIPDAPGYEKDQIVAIYAEGKEHALAVGVLTMSTEEIKSVNKGIGVNLMMYLGDGLWSLTDV